MVLVNIFKRDFKRNKMQSFNRQQQFNTIAKHVGFMPSCWLAINSLSYDRTPEGITPGSGEGAGYA